MAKWQGQIYKISINNRFKGPVLTWPNVTLVLNIVFQDILALTKVRPIVSSKRVIVHKNVLITNIQMQLLCDIPVWFGKWNSHANFIHTPQITRITHF